MVFSLRKTKDYSEEKCKIIQDDLDNVKSEMASIRQKFDEHEHHDNGWFVKMGEMLRNHHEQEIKQHDDIKREIKRKIPVFCIYTGILFIVSILVQLFLHH